MRRIVAALLFLLAAAATLGAQLFRWTPKDIQVEEDFRLGVLSYYRGQYGESILSLEKALSAAPEDSLVVSWLGYAYFRAGLETIAIERWQEGLALGFPSLSISNRVDLLKFSRSAVTPEGTDIVPYIDIQSMMGKTAKVDFFQRPATVLSESDGSIWTTAYGSNEVVLIDSNGMVLRHLSGSPGGFDRPFGMVDAGDGTLIVSESNGNRIAVVRKDGIVVRRFGKTGRGQGEFLGPQHLALDSSGYLYAVDFGNRRVVKMDTDGSFVLEFGKAKGSFPGFVNPTGITVFRGDIFVADSFRKAIYRFDRDGNFVSPLSRLGLSKPESLSRFDESRILVADGNRVLVLDPEREILGELWHAPDNGMKILSAAKDVNGNVVCADFDGNKIVYLADPANVYSGYDIRIDRVNAQAFPKVEARLTILDRSGNPVLGLKKSNFYITELVQTVEKRNENGKPVSILKENQVPVSDVSVSPVSANGAARADCVIVIEQSPSLAARTGEIRSVVSQIMDRYSRAGSVDIVRAGTQAARDSVLDPDALGRGIETAKYDPKWKLDGALKLAGQILSEKDNPRRTLYLISSGTVHEQSFSRYSLSEIRACLRNSGISLQVITLASSAVDRTIQYLSSGTDGGITFAFAPEGIVPRLEKDITRPMGCYSVSFTSKSNSEFGKAYLPLSVEIHSGKRSGREDTGYFSPLK